MEKFANTVLFAQCRETGFTEMTVRDMTDIVPESYRFDQVLIQPQAASDSPRDFRHKLDMDDPVGDMIVLDKIKNLCLIDIACICPCVDNTVSIAGIRGSDVFCSPVLTAYSICTGCSKGRKERF
jgi:hypothetical protein